MASPDPFPMRPTMRGPGRADPMSGMPRPAAPRSGDQRSGGQRSGGQPSGGQRSGVSRSGGADGNERLTALTGAVLLVLLAAEGFTILGIHHLITAHFFIGMLLLGPVTLKLCSTIYRFIRYYTGSAPYRRKGPPAPLLRLLGPVIVAATAGVFGSGVGLAISGPGNGPWLFLHKGSFVVWFGAMSIHVLYYLARVPRLIAADLRGRRASSPSASHGDQGYRDQGYRDQGYGRTAQDRPAYGRGHGDAGYGDGSGRGAGYERGGYARGGDGYDRGGYGYDRGGYGYDRGGYDRGHGGAGYERAVEILGGRGVRLALLVASLLAGLVIAELTVHLAAPWQFLQFGG